MHKLLILLILLSPPMWSQPNFDFEKWFGSLPNKESSELSLKEVVDMVVLIKGQYTTFTSDATKDLINSLPILD